MKFNRNVVIPITVGVIVCALGVINSKMPISQVLVGLVVIVAVVLVQQRNGNNLALMQIIGIVVAFLYVGILIALALLAKSHIWADKILRFPFWTG